MTTTTKPQRPIRITRLGNDTFATAGKGIRLHVNTDGTFTYYGRGTEGTLDRYGTVVLGQVDPVAFDMLAVLLADGAM